jgi:hypothetical protein
LTAGAAEFFIFNQSGERPEREAESFRFDTMPLRPVLQAWAKSRNLRTGGGKIVAMEGPAPKRVAITEWESLEKAEAFYKSKAWNDLTPQREKAVKTIRRYAVEAMN